MINNYLRLISKKGSVYKDCTLDSQNTKSFFSADLGANDYLYAGQVLPFNNLFFQIKSPNENTTSLTVDIWNGKEWIPCVDVLDATMALSSSGVLQWTLMRRMSWPEVVDTSTEGMGLDDFSIYGLHWVRISPNAELSEETEILRVRYKFTDQVQMEALDPDLPKILLAWGEDKQDWLDQILTASDAIALDLKGRKIIEQKNQVFRFDELYLPTAYKANSIIYSALGKEFHEKRDYASQMSRSLLGKQKLTIDKNKDGHIQRGEITSSGGSIYR